MIKLIFLFFISLFISFNNLYSQTNTPPNNLNLKSDYVLVKDYDTSKILLAKNYQSKVYPASLTKLLTIYITFESLKNKEISLNTITKVSRNAFTKGHYSTGGSTMFLKNNQNVSVENLIKGIIVVSGNDASIALAELISGSEEQFVEKMNNTAKRLHLNNSNFTNVYGNHNPNHYSTPEDMLILSKRIIEDFPEYYPYFSMKSFEYNNVSQNNRNSLLFHPTLDNVKIDGLKTGHTEVSEYSLIFSAIENNDENKDFRIIAVISGANSNNLRSKEAATIIRNIYSQYHKIILLKKGDAITNIPVLHGKLRSYPIVAKQDISVIVPKEYNIEDIKISLQTLDYITPILRQPGDQVASIIINTPESYFDMTYNFILDEKIKPISPVIEFLFAPYYAYKKLRATL